MLLAIHIGVITTGVVVIHLLGLIKSYLKKISIILLIFFLTSLAYSQNKRIVELPKDSALIYENFEVISSDRSYFSGINVNAFVQKYCIELKHDSLNDFVGIKYWANYRMYPGISRLIESLPQMTKNLLLSYPYNYALNHSSTRIWIDFVNKTSFSKVARRNFKITLNRCESKRGFPKIENAIMLSAREKDIWSVWIILDNGHSILWYYEGHRILGLDQIEAKEINGHPHSFKVFDKSGNDITEKYTTLNKD